MSDPAPTDQATACADALPATGERLRATLRAVASPVVVVTLATPDGPLGATIGSFTSVSLAPPLVSFNVTHGTRLHHAATDGAAVAIHLLTAGQAGVAARFAIPDLDGEAQLAPFPHRRRAGLPPVLAGTLGVLHGHIRTRVDVGDHTLVVVRVDRLVPGQEGEPLLYYQQSYRGVGASVEPEVVSP